MNFKDIVSSISESESIPAGNVRKSITSLLRMMGEALDNGETIRFPGYVLRTRTISAREEDGDSPAKPERRVATFKRRLVKQDGEDVKASTGDLE